MKVILNANIENLGRIGDMVDVKPGYARNYLLPRDFAVPPTKHNIEVMKLKKIKADKQMELDKMDARGQKEKLEALTLTIEKKAGESDTLFGSVTTTEIQELLELKGFSIEKKRFTLAEPIKRLGLHTCKIKLIEDIEAEIKIDVLREGGDLEEETTNEDVVEDVVEEEVVEEEVVEEEVIEEEVIEEKVIEKEVIEEDGIEEAVAEDVDESEEEEEEKKDVPADE